MLGNTGYDLDPFDGVFVPTIEPSWFRLRPVLGRTGYDHDPFERVLVGTMATLRNFGYDLGPATDNVGSNLRPRAGVLVPTWFRPWPYVGSFGSDLSPLCGRSGSQRGPMAGVLFPIMVVCVLIGSDLVVLSDEHFGSERGLFACEVPIVVRLSIHQSHGSRNVRGM